MRELIFQDSVATMRPWCCSDAKAFIKGTSSADIDLNLRPEFPRTVNDFIKYANACRLKAIIQDFAITQNKIIMGGLSFIDNSDLMVELACLWIAKPYRGRGLAEDAIRTLMNYILELYPDRGIFGQVYEFNEGEISMMNKLGFKRFGSKNVSYNGKTANLLRYEYIIYRGK